METMMHGQATVETVADARDPHGGDVIERVEGCRNLVWVRHDVRHVTRHRNGYDIGFTYQHGIGWFHEDNVRNFQYA